MTFPGYRRIGGSPPPSPTGPIGGSYRSPYIDSPTSALRIVPPALPGGFATGRGGFGTQPGQEMGAITGGFGASRGYVPGTQGPEMTGLWDPATMPGFAATRGGGMYSTPATSSMLMSFEESARNQGANRAQSPVPRRDPRFDMVSEGQDVVQDFWQEQYDRYVADMAFAEEDIRSQYSAGIEGLEDEIGDMRAAAAALGIPFDEYLATRHEIGGTVEGADPLSPTMMPVITKIYDDAEAEMKDVFAKIDMNLGPQATATIVGKMKDFEGTIEDVIRTDEASIDLLHEKSSEYAKALAQSAYSNDIYGALDAEVKINATLDNKIEEATEEVARQKRAMQAAIDAAQNRIAATTEWEEPTFDMVWGETLNEYFESNNVPPHERESAMGIFQQIMDSDPSYGLNEGAFRRGINDYFNTSALNAIGLNSETIERAVGETGNDALLQLISSQNVGQMFRNGQTKALEAAMAASGIDPKMIPRIIASGTRSADDLPSPDAAEAKHLRNMYTSRQQISSNWDNIVANFGPRVNEGDLIIAPNGYINPVVGGAKYSNDWGNPRGGGTRSHEGTDMFAPKGTPVVSPVDGTIVSIDYGKLGGNFVKVKDKQGNTHYLAHLDTQSKNISVGQSVRAGTVVGTVGNTGNAASTPPHLHYGIYTANGATNPYPVLESARGGQPAYVGAGSGYKSGGSTSTGKPKTPTTNRPKRKSTYRPRGKSTGFGYSSGRG